GEVDSVTCTTIPTPAALCQNARKAQLTMYTAHSTLSCNQHGTARQGYLFLLLDINPGIALRSVSVEAAAMFHVATWPHRADRVVVARNTRPVRHPDLVDDAGDFHKIVRLP